MQSGSKAIVLITSPSVHDKAVAASHVSFTLTPPTPRAMVAVPVGPKFRPKMVTRTPARAVQSEATKGLQSVDAHVEQQLAPHVTAGSLSLTTVGTA